MQQLRFRAMGCEMFAALDWDGVTSARALAYVPRWFAEWEQQLSRFRPDSELSVLNRSGYIRSASPALWQVVQIALAQACETDGLVSPTLLHALEAAGYDRSFEILCRDALPQEASNAHFSAPAWSSTERTDWKAIECDPETRSIQLPTGVRLDLGGIAKGWAVDEAVCRLAAYGPALVDAGGDVAVNGARADGTPWPIGVAHPGTIEEQLDLLLLDHGGVATSGRDYRRWQRYGIWKHHLIDPRTMQPAITDVLSTTVIGSCAAACEAAAKVVLLLGSDEGLRWLEARPQLAGLVALEDGEVIRSRRLDSYRWRAEPIEGSSM